MARSEFAGACEACLRRTRLLELLAPHIERARHQRRLPQLLALADAELVAAIGGARRAAVAAAVEHFDAEAARAKLRGAGLTARCRHAADYPARLLVAADAPAVLTIAGDATLLDTLADERAIAVAIVGARRATAYGREMARSLGRALAGAGVPVVSGLALGIDAAAHAGALDAGGPTIAVLAGGADRPYPRSSASLHRRIVAGGGCVVSEMPAGFVPFKWGFPARNRTIAGLADLTVVVEAAARSGSLITAELAQDLGRVVAAVPGPVTSPASAGANALLRDGAAVVRDAQDVLDTLLGAGVATIGSDQLAGLDPRLLALLERVGEQATGLAPLLAASADVDATLAALTELELLGLVRRAPGGMYVRVPA
ncbi:MAG TPA: DNA-processing protein DprA [Solirubrobacteraceae bacterium]|nr:DNA-processing protein DprA [Solirubrobacteraceae bacterium]